MLKNKYNPEIIVPANVSALKFFFSLSKGIKKYIFANPEKINILDTPLKKVSLIPLPNIGKALYHTKDFAVETKITIILKSKNGRSIKLFLTIPEMPRMVEIVVAATKNPNI